jgi:type I restriction enzyme, S subunit
MTELPDSWKLLTIGEVADIVRGVTYSKGDTLSATDNDAVPLLRATNLEVDSIDFEDMVYVPKRVVKAQQYLQLDDIFMAASSGSISVVGKSAQVVKTNGETFGAFCAVIRPKNINPKFLAYWVQSPAIRDHWSTTAKGTNINNLKPSDISETNIPVPSKDQQHKIVELLEDHLARLDAALADVKQAKLRAAQFRNVYIDDFLKKSEGLKTNLGSILKFSSGFAYKSSIWQDSGIPVVKIMNVKNREVNLEGCSFVSPEIAESSKSFCVKKGDLLFNMTGATLGAFGFYNLEREARMNQRVGKFVPLNASELNLNYLAYFLEAASTQRMIQQLAKGAAQPNISPTDILSLEINLPDFVMQKAIVDELEAALYKITQVDQFCRITRLESKAFRRSLLQAAFTGQLTNEVVSV